MSDPSLWSLRNFDDHLDLWIHIDNPGQELRHLVTSWVLSRFDDPYQGVQREPGFDNLWWGQIPYSLDGGTVVVCTYMVEESTRTVTCKSITSLSLPI